jgi:hypothetical protein
VETLNELPPDLMKLPGGVYRTGSDLNPRIFRVYLKYSYSPVEACEIQKVVLEEDHPVFIVTRTTSDGLFYVEKSRISHKAAMNGTTVPFKVAVNMAPLPVTSDGYFVLPVREKMLTITGEMMMEDDFKKTAAPLHANLRRVYYKQQGVDILSDKLVRDKTLRFAVWDVPEKGLSFVVIVRLKVTKAWMETQFNTIIHPGPNEQLSHLVYVPVGSELPAEGTKEWADLVGSRHADCKVWEYLPELLSGANSIL